MVTRGTQAVGGTWDRRAAIGRAGVTPTRSWPRLKMTWWAGWRKKTGFTLALALATVHSLLLKLLFAFDELTGSQTVLTD